MLVFLFLSTLCHLAFAFTSCPPRLSPLVGQTFTYNFDPILSQVIFSICGTINQTCGSLGHTCWNVTSGCCCTCQTWVQDDGPQSACIGTVFQSAEVYPNNTVVLTYSRGDPIDGVFSRLLVLSIECGKDKFKPGKFVQPNYSPPPQPGQPYIYYLTVESIYACAQCPLSTTCDTCASTNCMWCLDNNTCQESTNTCNNFIKNPQYCPNTCHTYSTCDQCTNGGCAWCVGESECVPVYGKDQCVNGVVENPSFCKI